MSFYPYHADFKRCQMNIIGVYDGHSANAALIEDGKIIRAVEEERFNRVKNYEGRQIV